MQKDLDFLKQLGLLDDQMYSKVLKLLPGLSTQDSLQLQELLVDVYLKIAKSMDMDLSDLQGQLDSKAKEMGNEFYDRIKEKQLNKEAVEIRELEDLINSM